MIYYTSFAAIPVVIGILLFGIIANASMISAQQGSIITDKVPPLPTSKLHAVKIISPAKGQQVPIGKDLTVSGITSTWRRKCNVPLSSIHYREWREAISTS